MIQLMVRKPLGELNNLPDKKGDGKKKDEEMVEVKEEKVKVAEVGESKVYKVGDGLDVRDRETGETIRLDALFLLRHGVCHPKDTYIILKGAWFEARIVKIMTGDEVAGGDGMAYHIVYEGYPDFGPVKVINASYVYCQRLTFCWSLGEV